MLTLLMSYDISWIAMLTLLVSEEKFRHCNANLQMSDKSSENAMLTLLVSSKRSGQEIQC